MTSFVLTLAGLTAQAPDPVTQPMADQVERLHREADRIRAEARASFDADEIRREVQRAIQSAASLGVAASQQASEAVRNAMAQVEKSKTEWATSHGRSGSSAYRSGLRALDERKWDDAIEHFKRSDKYKPDAALYWTAFAHYKAGRVPNALTTIATLNNTYGSSAWRNDAQTLEVEIKAAQGKPVNPDSVADDEIKLIALSGLVRTDAEKAMPHLEKLVASSQSPRVKEETLYLLARTNSPKARDLVAKVARSGNPEIQMKAIHALGRMEQKDSGNILVQIYNDASSREVKEEAMDALHEQRAIPALITIARSEKNIDLKKRAVRLLSRSNNKEAQDYLSELLSK